MLVTDVFEYNDRMTTLNNLEDLLKVVTAGGHHQFVHWEEFALTCHRGIRVGLLKIPGKRTSLSSMHKIVFNYLMTMRLA